MACPRSVATRLSRRWYDDFEVPYVPKIQFTLNGKATEASYEPGMHLLEVLREECGVVSAKNGCAPEGACGCCLVMIDGRPALSCLRKPEQMQGHDDRHARGSARGDAARHRARHSSWKVACSAASASRGSWSARRRSSSMARAAIATPIAKALDGHLCRCTGYGRIIDAIQTAGEAAAMAGSSPRSRGATFFWRGVRPQPGPGVCRRDRVHGSRDRPFGRASRRRWRRHSAKSRSWTTCACPACSTARWCPTKHPRARVLKIRHRGCRGDAGGRAGIHRGGRPRDREAWASTIPISPCSSPRAK